MKTLLTLLILVLSSTLAFAHGGEEHKKEQQQDTVVSGNEDVNHHETDVNVVEQHISHQHPENTMASLSDFPSLHPLIVHFPIVLLLLAFLLQTTSLFVFNESLSWVTIIILALGLTGAIVAGKYVHPHTTNEISERAALVLAEHERFASFTIWFSGIALLFKIISQFFLKKKLVVEIIIALILLGAAISVGIAGHHGADLVHIEGIGPQGKFLETNHNH
jgi:uncharacterized membrane protein